MVEGRGMNSRVHPNHRTKYRVTNWAEYDQALVQRGDITLWITPAAVKAWKPRASNRHGAPRRYSDLAIETVLMLQLVFQWRRVALGRYLPRAPTDPDMRD